jgi:hypothetical protein
LRSWSSGSSCLVHLLFEEDPHVVGEGGILQLPPIQLREVGLQDAVAISTSYPRRTPLIRREEFYESPLRLKAVGPREQLLIHLLSEEDPLLLEREEFYDYPPIQLREVDSLE